MVVEVYYKEENDLTEFFCDNIAKCNASNGGNESDPNGCYGCDAMDNWLDENYHKHMIDESNHKTFISTEELNKYLGLVMNKRNDEKTMRLMIIDLLLKIKKGL